MKRIIALGSIVLAGALTVVVAAQQQAPQPVIPSRFGPQDMSFVSLFSTEAAGPVGSPVEPTEAAAGAAFFTQLYGQ